MDSLSNTLVIASSCPLCENGIGKKDFLIFGRVQQFLNDYKEYKLINCLLGPICENTCNSHPNISKKDLFNYCKNFLHSF